MIDIILQKGGRGLLDFKISPATAEDSHALVELLDLPAVRYGTFVNPFNTSRFVQRLQQHASEGDLNLVARSEAGVIGQATLTANRGRRRHAGSVFVAVHDNHAGRGVGSSLLGSILEYSDRWFELSRLEIFVFADNSSAINLYKKMGFTEEGLHKGYAFRDGFRADCLSMARMRGDDKLA